MKEWIKRYLGIKELSSKLDDNARDNKSTVRRLNNEVEQLKELLSDLVNIDIDVHAVKNAQTTIIISTHLKGGQVRIVPTKFRDYRELLDFIANLTDRYNTRNYMFDAGHGNKCVLYQEMEMRTGRRSCQNLKKF